MSATEISWSGASIFDALQRGDVHEHAPREERADLFDTQLAEAGARGDLGDGHTVVEAAVDALVREHVELRADLSQLGDDKLLVAVRACWRQAGRWCAW